MQEGFQSSLKNGQQHQVPASETHPAAPSSAKQSAAPSLQDLNTATWRLKDKKGIEVGNVVKRDGSSITYKVISIHDQEGKILVEKAVLFGIEEPPFKGNADMLDML